MTPTAPCSLGVVQGECFFSQVREALKCKASPNCITSLGVLKSNVKQSCFARVTKCILYLNIIKTLKTNGERDFPSLW